MNRNEILSKLESIIREFTDNEELALTMETTNEDIEEWDSVAHIQIIFELEEAFELQFDAEEIVELNSVEKIINAIERIKGR